MFSYSLAGFEINEEYNFPYDEERADSMKDILENSNADELANTYLWSDNALKENSPTVYYISKVLNYFLAILAFIAFLVLLYWFSLVFTQWRSNESMKKWYNYIKMAVIAIIIIWISWLFSIWIFSIYNNNVIQ